MHPITNSGFFSKSFRRSEVGGDRQRPLAETMETNRQEAGSQLSGNDAPRSSGARSDITNARHCMPHGRSAWRLCGAAGFRPWAVDGLCPASELPSAFRFPPAFRFLPNQAFVITASSLRACWYHQRSVRGHMLPILRPVKDLQRHRRRHGLNLSQPKSLRSKGTDV